MLGIWNEAAKLLAEGRRIYVVALIIGCLGGLAFAAADASAATPTGAQWEQEAYREAIRRCQEIERNSIHIDFGIKGITCVRSGQWAPDAGPCMRLNLANHNAWCSASFVVSYNFGKYAGFNRLYSGKVHMHYVKTRRIVFPSGRVRYVPVIAVERPVGWRAVGWVVRGRDPRD